MRTGKARLIEQLEDLIYDYQEDVNDIENIPYLLNKWADRIMFDINHGIISKETE